MSRLGRIRLAIATTAAAVLGSAPATVWACSVCQGDPNSDLVKGAKSGVLLMMLVTYSVLLGFAGFATLWFVRSRRLTPPIAPRSHDSLTDAADSNRPRSGVAGTDD